MSHRQISFPLRPVDLLLASTLLLGACSEGSRSTGVQVYFTLTPEPENHAPQPAGPKQFTNTEGTAIRLDKAYLAMWSVALHTDCDDSGFVWNRSWTPRLDWLISSAHAHTDASPTLLGTPTVVNLLASDGEPQDWGALAPSANAYCGATWQVLAADEDAENLPIDTNMVGLSLVLGGHYGADNQPFALSTSRAFSPAKRRFAIPLTLGAEQKQATAQLNIAYDRWFDSLDMDALARGDDTATTQLLQNISQTFRVDVQALAEGLTD